MGEKNKVHNLMYSMTLCVFMCVHVYFKGVV